MASTAFDDIIQALHGAVIEAQRMAERQYGDFIQRYFETKEGGSVMEAKTVDIAVRTLRPDAEPDAHDVIQVPLICLAAPSAIKIRELSVEFETELSSISVTGNAPGSTAPHHVYVDVTTPPAGADAHKSTTAKVTISFQGTDPPEGVLRINDIMLKRLP